MDTIQMDYNQAIREAKRLESVAEDCKNCSTLVDKLIRLVPTYWQGEAATAFIDELNEWKRENNSIRTEAKTLGSNIRDVAERIREAEIRAMEAINEE